MSATVPETLTLGGVPLTVLGAPGTASHESRGCVLCYHGFTSSTSAWLADLHALARRGFTVIGVDAVGHGRRRYPDFARRFADPRTYGRRFVDVVRETSDEIPALVDALTARGLVPDGRLGLVGVSMGGFVAYAAVGKEPRLRAAVSLVGSPEWWMHPSDESPHHRPEAFDAVRFLSMTAGRDVVVPGRYAARFHERLAGRFADADERLPHVDYPDSDHRLSPDWSRAAEATNDWLERYLGPSPP